MKADSFGVRLRFFSKKHKKIFIALGISIGVWILLSRIGASYEPLDPKVLFSKESADAAKQYILSFDWAAPIVFLLLQVLQVIFAPVPGQASGFAGGYVFGWQWGVTYTMIGLTLGSLIVFILSRKFGRRFVEKLNGPEALKDFEELFLPSESKTGRLYEKSKQGVGSHGLLTYFMIMLLPALPDDLVCFIVGLTAIPIWQLTIATIVGRFPGMLVLSLVGDGFSKAESNAVLLVFIAVTVVCTALYFWKRQQIEAMMKRVALRSGRASI
jgi:uncharacterized membrane protein YdjX (TVP38/TMEM64 family)